MTSPMTLGEIVHELRALGDPDDARGMARFGITPEQAYGVRMPELRRLGKRVGTDHELAAALWERDTRETRILASLVDEPALVTAAQMDAWASEFTYWEICDQCCMNLFWRAEHAWAKAAEWAGVEAEYVKRAGFALMAVLAWKDKVAEDSAIAGLLALVEREADDGRPMVSKAVDWALRQIGKRNEALNERAVRSARALAGSGDAHARRVGARSLKELTSESVCGRLRRAGGTGDR